MAGQPIQSFGILTVSVFAEVVLGGLGGLRLAGLVDGPHAELVDHLLLQAVHLHLGLVVRRLRHLRSDADGGVSGVRQSPGDIGAPGEDE